MMMPARVEAGGRVFYSHPGALVTAPKLDRPWRPAPLPPLGAADLRRVLEGLKNLS